MLNPILSKSSFTFYTTITEKFGGILRIKPAYSGKNESISRTPTYVGTVENTPQNQELFTQLSEYLQWTNNFGLRITRYGRATNRRERGFGDTISGRDGDRFDIYIERNYDNNVVERLRKKWMVPMDSSFEKYQTHMKNRRDRQNGKTVVSQVETNSTVTLTDDEKIILSKASIILERISN